jgi:hypothetical protein
MSEFAHYLLGQAAAGSMTVAAAKAIVQQLLDRLAPLKQLPPKAAKHPQTQACTAPGSAQQQQHLGTSQGLSSAGAADADASGASAAVAAAAGGASAAAAASAAGTESLDSEQLAALGEQHPAAAGTGAAGTVTVGQSCSASPELQLNTELRVWARVCYPDASTEALDAVPVANLLPGLDSYLQQLQQRVAGKEIRPQAAVVAVQHLHSWVWQNQRQLGGCDSVTVSSALQQLQAAQLGFTQESFDSSLNSDIRTSAQADSDATQPASRTPAAAAAAPTAAAAHAAGASPLLTAADGSPAAAMPAQTGTGAQATASGATATAGINLQSNPLSSSTAGSSRSST